MIREVQSLKSLKSNHWPHPVQMGNESRRGGNLSKGIDKLVTDLGLNLRFCTSSLPAQPTMGPVRRKSRERVPPVYFQADSY